MSRRLSSSSPPPPPKRLKTSHLTPDDFKNGIVLAPMVRSGSLPTRLFALKHGATLVWSPETVDQAILHTERVVDPETGVISYNGKSKAIFVTHPVEKPYLIFQIGSANPETAVQAAKIVMQDVSGIDLNCGCPKPFSTHAGMGAALLTNPDLLCSILTALRREMPPEITVTAKIRLLPSQEDTLKLVERIVNTGISALTVHCRTRNQRMREKAHIERLREIVDFVDSMGKGIAVIANGDCQGYEDSKRLLGITGASSSMIATAAESNPTCFSPTPLLDLEYSLMPSYLRLGRYLGNHFSNTKFCVLQFKGSHGDAGLKKSDRTKIRELISRAKSYDELSSNVEGKWTGAEEFQEIVQTIKNRTVSRALEKWSANETSDSSVLATAPPLAAIAPSSSDSESETMLGTPPENRENPEPGALGTPKLPLTGHFRNLPSMLSGQDHPTPTPTPIELKGALSLSEA